MPELKTTPKVFLSYAWTDEKYRDNVAAFARRLSEEGGVEVVSDFWDIKPGQDMYKFMEASVHDDSITKVLILCNEVYAKKADDAKGGVGTETLIISPYVYERTDQVKYIPVPFLISSEDPRNALPIYLKGRNYIDMSTPDRVESNFMTLVKWIYDKPEYSKPKVGSVPSYILNGDSSSPSTLELLETAAAFKHKSSVYAAEIKKINEFSADVSEFLLKCRDAEPAISTENIRAVIDKITPARDYVLDAMENTILAGGNASALLTATLQNIEDVVMVRSKDVSLNNYSYQPYEFLVYEIILYSSALMLHYQAISELFDLLNQKFCLHEHYDSNYGKKIYSIVDLEKLQAETITSPQLSI